MRVGMVAGEASGDMLAALLLGGLRQRWPDLQAAGIGGPALGRLGFEAWWPHHKLAVHGFDMELVRKFREIWTIRERLGDRLLQDRPDVFIGVDAPDFNLGLEARLKQAGVPTVHFVSPSVWAWRGGRVKKIHRSADHILCLFPFEPEIYHRAGVGATFVGHPLADVIPLVPPRAASRQALGLSESDTVVAVLPGSRRGEIRHVAPDCLKAVALLARQRPGLRFVLPVVPGLRSMVEPLVAAHCPQAPLQLVDGRSHEVLAACDVTLIASGTATLEAALFKVPMVITYRVSWLSGQIMQRMGYLPWVGLPNILARDFVVPELIQADATPEALARETLAWLDAPERVAAVRRRFHDMHLSLKQDTARLATEAVAALLAQRKAKADGPQAR